MLVDDLKKSITVAMKSGDTLARDVLRLALGEIQTAEARGAGALSEDDVAASIRKLIKSNEETLALSGEGERADTLRRENEILSGLLPKQMTAAEVASVLAPQAEAIKAAKNDGQATGIAMKHLKTTGASVSGNVVAEAVKTIRGA